MDALTTTQSTAAKQYIVIKLGSEQYGVNINYIDNIVRMQRITVSSICAERLFR